MIFDYTVTIAGAAGTYFEILAPAAVGSIWVLKRLIISVDTGGTNHSFHVRGGFADVDATGTVVLTTQSIRTGIQVPTQYDYHDVELRPLDGLYANTFLLGATISGVVEVEEMRI